MKIAFYVEFKDLCMATSFYLSARPQGMGSFQPGISKAQLKEKPQEKRKNANTEHLFRSGGTHSWIILFKTNKYLLMESYTSVLISCYFPPKCKDQGGMDVFILSNAVCPEPGTVVGTKQGTHWLNAVHGHHLPLWMGTRWWWGQDSVGGPVSSHDMAVQPTLSFITTEFQTRMVPTQSQASWTECLQYSQKLTELFLETDYSSSLCNSCQCPIYKRVRCG